MNLTVEDVGQCKKILKFEVPKETVEEEIEKKTMDVCNTVELPGFRKGRVPRKLVEKRFGSHIKEEVAQSVINNCYQKALEEHKLNPVGNPQFSDVKLELGQPFSFDITLEVWPSFEVDNYKGLRLTKKSAVVTDEDIANAMKGLGEQKAQLIVVTDGIATEEDKIICDYKVKVGKDCVLEDEDIEISLIDNTEIADTPIPDLVEKIKGAKSGETRKVNVNLSNNFTGEAYRGKKAEIVLTIKEIKRLTYPDINEDFAKTIGFESLDDLMVKVRKRIEVDKKNWVEDDLKGQIFNILLEQIKFDLPQELVNYYTEKRAYKYQLDMLKGGISLEEIQKRTAAIKNASADSVARELRASLITERIAEKERIFVTENEVEQRIAAIAHAYNTDTSRVRKQLEHQGSLSNLRSEMRENKVVDFLLKEAKIEEESQATVKTKKKEAKSKE